MKTKMFISILLIGTLVSCSKDDENTNATGGGNTTQPPSNDGIVRYVNDVAPIINSNCTGCHGNPPTNSAPMHLTSYDAVKDAVLNRGLISRISLPQGDANMMPKNGTRLPQTAIDKIIEWQSDGFVNSN